MTFSTFDLDVGTRTLFGEFRGEPREAQQAGAHVLINRLRTGRWGSTLAQVCLAHAQFSCWLQVDPNYKIITGDIENNGMYQFLKHLLMDAATETDPTNGATSYYALSMKTPPYWVSQATFCGKFGNSNFYKGI